MPHSSLAIANEFLRRARKSSSGLTQMQLQKLVYLANGWTLAALDKPLIEDDIEAWEYGPVIRKLYDATRRYGSGPVTRPIRWGDDTPFGTDDDGEAREQLGEKEPQILDAVWRAYGNLKAFQLSALTHASGSPWDMAYRPGMNRIIPSDKIKEYFRGLSTDQQRIRERA